MKRLILALLCTALVIPGVVPVAFARVPNDTFYAQQWYLKQVNAEGAWDMETGSGNVVVAVIDTGVDITHEDLHENIWVNPGEISGNGIDDDGNGFIDDVHGWNFVRESNDVRPRKQGSTEEAYVHGTLVSSIIGARGNNGIGIAGVAWDVKIMPIVGLDETGSGLTTDIANAINYAVQNGADIINLSIEGSMRDIHLDEALAYARSRGVLSVTAAGNSGITQGTDLDLYPVYPACATLDGIYGVTAVGGTGRGDVKAVYSNYGSCIDVSAPSEEIFAAQPVDGTVSARSGYGGGFSGTSLAVPIVSGAAALLKSQNPSWGAAELRDRIMETSEPIDELNLPMYEGKLGIGRLDITAALEGLTPVSPESFEIMASKPGVPTRIRIISDTGIVQAAPFGIEDERGARAAVADVDGDGIPEIGVVTASGTNAEAVVLGRNGQVRYQFMLPGTFTDGALIVGTDDGFVIADESGGAAWGINSAFEVKLFFPYESHYAEGLDLMAVSGATAFAPRMGGGRLVIVNANGEQLVSAFPFGLEPYGRWSLARMELDGQTSLVFSGPEGTKSLNQYELGQTGWTDVTFADLERSVLTQSSGQMTGDMNVISYGTWPQ